MEAYQIAFWLVTAIFGIVVMVASSMFSRWANRIDRNFDELFDKIDKLADKGEFGKLKDKVSDHHDRIVKLEQKIINCKSCNPNGKNN